jgi:hypothetical protein
MDTKKIQVDLSSKQPKQEKPQKPEPKVRQKRIVTNSAKWILQDPEIQFQFIQQIYENAQTTIYDEPTKKLILQQITQKISGYRSQDVDKNIYSQSEFVDLDKALELMVSSKNECFYCKNRVHVLYEYVREPKQWTLERIDNKFGHNKTNVVIACLDCNLHRRTMYHERYLFTKQLNLIKQ